MNRVLCAGLALALTMPLCAATWEDLRNRPGNDDIFVMVDTSASMAPSAGGSLSIVKLFLQDLFVRYVKEGDRVILMSFDSEAHLQGVVPIVDRRRDSELLREVIDGLDARRVIHFSGIYPDLVETGKGPLTGGGAWTNYCEMWQLSSRVIQRYGDARHRQLFLLLTGDPPSAPLYHPCTNQDGSEVFLPAFSQGRLRMGVVALPSRSGSSPELAAFLSRLLQRMPAQRIDFKDRGRRIDGLRRDVLELLNSRIDLIQPGDLNLGVHYKIDLHAPLTLINHSRMQRTLSIQHAVIHLTNGNLLPLDVTPSTVTILPGQTGTIVVSRSDLFEKAGSYDGNVVFDFATATRFDPAIVPFSARKQTWLEAYGTLVWWMMFMCVMLVTLVLLRPRQTGGKDVLDD